MADLQNPISPEDPGAALGTEWILTNGLGGYAMGSVPGANTRGYHGLLVAATAPPASRVLALHSVIDEIIVGRHRLDLATQLFDDGAMLHPDGWRALTRFRADPPSSCTWTYRFGRLVVERRLTLARGRNAIILTYRIDGLTTPARLRVRLLTPLRSFHEIGREGVAAEPALASGTSEQGPVRILAGGVELCVRSGGGCWRDDPQWWRGLVYPEERDRGLSWVEDVWSPGVVEHALAPDGPIAIRLEAEVVEPERAVIPAPLPSCGGDPSSAESRLERAADQFVVRRDGAEGGTMTIIAGYPWFADWGRDTMISLPGLLLASGRDREAGSVLLGFARRIRRGIIPNRFHDTEPTLYNTVDASLWFIDAVHACASALSPADRRELVDACRSIIRAYRDGTDYAIRLDEDELVAAGDGSAALTWMDARRDGVTFTPRDGKPVEISALWYNALLRLAELTEDELEAAGLLRDAERTARSFRRSFWWSERRCLHDVLVARGSEGWRPDGRLRPNQIFAVGLAHSPLTEQQQRAVLETVERRLLTPYGLRTLDPDDPGYHGRYEGDLMQRDAAYHNGTVWPWLLGPYCAAALRVHGAGETGRLRVTRAITPLLSSLDDGCLDQLAEVYDGDAPHRASGCPAQAWSVAEIRRVLLLLSTATAPRAGGPAPDLASHR